MKKCVNSFKTALLVGLGISILAPVELSAQGSENPMFDFTADYVVVGLGGAGCVVARRLSDDFSTFVFAIEAGANEVNDQELQSVTNSPRNQFFPKYFWQGVTVRQDQLIPSTTIFDWTGGRTFGGSFIVNGLQFVRGTPQLWQQYEDKLGSDWSVSEVFRRYKELECFQGPVINPTTRGTTGLLDNLELPLNPSDDANFILGALESVSGLDAIVDYNDQSLAPIGPFSRWNSYQKKENGLRESTATAFLDTDVMSFDGKGLNGRELEVSFNSTFVSLIWDDSPGGNSNKVIGVRFSREGECFNVKANKEVIISAGFRSAQLLQLSGIGPEDVLNDAGCPIHVVNNNVGQHLTNHPSVRGITFSAQGLDPEPKPPVGFTSRFPLPGAFLPAILPVVNPNAPGIGREVQWINSAKVADNPDDSSIGLTALLLFPKSEGTIKIQDCDPFKIALVDVNYFADQEDIDTMITGIQSYVLGLDNYFRVNNPPKGAPKWGLLTPLRATIEDPVLLKNYILENVGQAHHWASSTRMGLNADDAVVDSRGRVFGCENLRVADNSILFTQTDGNLGGPAALVGWTISEFVIKDNA